MKQKEDDYFFPLKNLYFDRHYLISFLKESVDESDWYVFDCGKLRWTVREHYGNQRTECTKFKRTRFFQELFNLFTIPINSGDILFTRTPPPGIPPHIDRNRPAAINFPVLGSLKDSPMAWYSDFDSSKKIMEYDHCFQSSITHELAPVLFNPQKIHGVENKRDRTRCLLSIWWRDHSFEEVKAFWKKGSLINWKVNEQNTYVKYIH